MKTGKILLITCLLCAVMALTAVFGAVAEEQPINTCGENLTWKIEGDTLIISGTGPMDNYTYGPVPSEDGEGTVTAGTAPWYGDRSFTKIIVEEGVTTLGNCAFFNNTNILSVSLPETLVSIGGYVFNYDSNLRDINLPDSITSIGLCAFTGCDFLRNIRLPASLTTIQAAVFNSCNQLLELRIPDAVTAIQGSPFAYCKNLETIAVPASVTEIDPKAFDNCPALKNILVVTGSYAEQYCIDNNLPYTAMDVLPEYEEPAGNAKLSWKVENGTLTISGTGSIEDFSLDNAAPWNQEKYTRLVVEEGITSLGNYAFHGHPELTEAILPESLLYIEDHTFSNTGLTKITVPGSVIRIGYMAFWHCIQLKDVTLPESLKEIDLRAFLDCSRLEHINLPASLHTIGFEAFEECGAAVFTVERGSYAEQYCIDKNLSYNHGDRSPAHMPVGNGAISWKVENGTLTISGTGAMDDYNDIFGMHGTEGTLEFAGANTPWDEESFSRIVIEDGITSIGKNTFKNREALISVTLPDTLVSIGQEAFMGNQSLEEINLPDSLTSIGPNAFVLCRSLKSLTLPASLKEIGYGVFQGCESLKEIRIPDSVSLLDSFTFSRCISLEKVIIPASVTKMEWDIFRGCDSLKEIVVEKGSCAEQYCIDNNLPCTYAE